MPAGKNCPPASPSTHNPRLALSQAEGGQTPESNIVTVIVDHSGAVYPLTIDPFIQQAYLKASNAEASDYFGRSLAISGDTVVVGAYAEDSNGTGESDNSAWGAGAAYVYERSGAAWSQQAYLKASNAEGGDQFGDGSLRCDTDEIFVGWILTKGRL